MFFKCTQIDKLKYLKQLLFENANPETISEMVIHRFHGGSFRLLFWGAMTEPKRRISVFFDYPIDKCTATTNIPGAIMIPIKSSSLLSFVEGQLQLGLVYPYI